ncbi:hypothetical protein Syun_016575 [Stephania yunnanensis]|uniref:Uncharacterized protein n=1 Tax=Stephania yunnanensis TaxID=152371 RepID=A0AAP0P2B6_9MAGN
MSWNEGFEGRGFIARSPISIGDLLLERAFNEHEFEEVRKLAAELCGRIHPKVSYLLKSLTKQ